MMKALKKGMEKGIEKGLERGKEDVLRKFLEKGFSPEQIAETIGAPVDEIRKLIKK